MFSYSADHKGYMRLHTQARWPVWRLIHVLCRGPQAVRRFVRFASTGGLAVLAVCAVSFGPVIAAGQMSQVIAFILHFKYDISRVLTAKLLLRKHQAPLSLNEGANGMLISLFTL